MPVKHPLWKDGSEPEIDEENLDFESPPRAIGGSKSFVLIKRKESSPVYEMINGTISTQETCLRAELEVLKAQLDKSQRQNLDLQSQIQDLQSSLQSAKSELLSYKKTCQSQKQQLLETSTDFDLQKSKFSAQVQILQAENQKLSEKINEYKYIETQEPIIRHEFETKYRTKYLKLKDLLKTKAEKLKKKEKDLKSEKLLFTQQVSAMIHKFSALQVKFPSLSQVFSPVITNKT